MVKLSQIPFQSTESCKISWEHALLASVAFKCIVCAYTDGLITIAVLDLALECVIFSVNKGLLYNFVDQTNILFI